MMNEPTKKAGRPQGPPSKVLPVRIPVGLMDRLDRYLDWVENRTGLRSNRNEAIRQALGAWLNDKEESLGIPPRPAWADIPSARQQWWGAYSAVDEGQEVVRIDHIRERLDWSPDAFDQMIATLVSENRVDLQRSDSDHLSEREGADGYCDADGVVYLGISRRRNQVMDKLV